MQKFGILLVCMNGWSSSVGASQRITELVKHVIHGNHLTSGVWPSPFRIRTNIPPTGKRNIIDSNMPLTGDMLVSWRVSSFESTMLLFKEFVLVWAKFTPGIGGNLKPSFFVILLQMYFLQVLYHQFTHQSLTCEARSSGAEWCLWWWRARCFRRRDFFWGNFILGKLSKTSSFEIFMNYFVKHQIDSYEETPVTTLENVWCRAFFLQLFFAAQSIIHSFHSYWYLVKWRLKNCHDCCHCVLQKTT